MKTYEVIDSAGIDSLPRLVEASSPQEAAILASFPSFDLSKLVRSEETIRPGVTLPGCWFWEDPDLYDSYGSDLFAVYAINYGRSAFSNCYEVYFNGGFFAMLEIVETCPVL